MNTVDQDTANATNYEELNQRKP